MKQQDKVFFEQKTWHSRFVAAELFFLVHMRLLPIVKLSLRTLDLWGLTSLIFCPKLQDPKVEKQLMQQFNSYIICFKNLQNNDKINITTIRLLKILHCLLGVLEELHLDHGLPELLVDSGQLWDQLPIALNLIWRNYNS